MDKIEEKIKELERRIQWLEEVNSSLLDWAETNRIIWEDRQKWQSILANQEAARLGLKPPRAAGGGGKSTEERRRKAVEHFERIGISRDKLLAALGVDREEKIGTGELATMRGWVTAIETGEITAAGLEGMG